ncbi:MAG: hypothetical protein PHI55_00025 [Burkholderiaceae bacterium]|nr:hypothetical protein [Burkholderiaceae bacterium]
MAKTCSSHTRRGWVLSGLALGLAACTTTPTAPPVAQGVQRAPDGSVTVFHRKSSGSLGAYDGQVEWTHRTGSWQGLPAVVMASPQFGTTLYEPASMGVWANLAPNGTPVFSYQPAMAYPWPLSVGKTWTSHHTVTVHATGATVPLRIDGRVESWGDVTVPAGTFKAYKVVLQMDNGDQDTYWFNPEPGLAILKRQMVRSARHPQGAGTLEAELLSVKRPGR